MSVRPGKSGASAMHPGERTCPSCGATRLAARLPDHLAEECANAPRKVS